MFCILILFAKQHQRKEEDPNHTNIDDDGRCLFVVGAILMMIYTRMDDYVMVVDNKKLMRINQSNYYC